MNTKTKLLGVVLAIGLIGTGCKARKNAVDDEKKEDTTITLEIQYSEQPCGGAEPPDDVLEEMNQLKPYANKKLYIATPDGITPTGMIKVVGEEMVKLDGEGKAVLKLDSGQYFMSFYSLMPKVEDNKPNSTDNDAPENPAEPEAGQETLMSKEECEQQWRLITAVPLHIIPSKKHYLIPMQKECNPCEEPKP